jgi:acetoin utilization protein AcuC
VGPVTVAWDDALLAYDFGPEHPLRPQRVELTVALAAACGLLEPATIVRPGPPPGAALARVHDLDYLAAVQAASPDGRAVPRHGIGTDDTPPFPGMHEASALVCGATLAAAGAVHDGSALHAFSPAGGLHHAMAGRASGFCVYNDPAVAIAWLLDQGAGRIGYVDVDVHHGDGVERVFADDPRVLTISLHETGRILFPGTGFPDEIGEGEARGSIANLPLPPWTTDDLYLAAFDVLVPPLLRAFQPEILVTQLGCDSHYGDPLAHLALTVGAYRALAERFHGLAHTITEGRWLATGGGGYQWAEVVPRAWSTYLAEMVGVDLPAELPEGYRRMVAERYGVDLDPRMADDAVMLKSEHRTRAEREINDALETVCGALFPIHNVRL